MVLNGVQYHIDDVVRDEEKIDGQLTVVKAVDQSTVDSTLLQLIVDQSWRGTTERFCIVWWSSRVPGREVSVYSIGSPCSVMIVSAREELSSERGACRPSRI